MRLRLVVLLVFSLLLAGCASPQRQLARALKLERENRPDKALVEYEDLLRRTPRQQLQRISQLYLRIGGCLWRLDRGNDALVAFQQSVETDETNLAAHLRVAELYLIGGAVQHSLEHAQAVLAREPYNAEALGIVGAIHEATDDPVGAKQAYLSALRSDPKRVTVAIALADVYKHENRPQEARDVLQGSAAASPNDAAPLLALGQLEEEQGNVAAAEAEYRKAIQRENTPMTNLRLAQFLERSSRVAEAEAVLRRSDNLQPAQPVSLADFEMISGRAFRALRHYMDVLEGGSQHRLAIARTGRGMVAARLVEADLESPNGTGTEPLRAAAPSAVARARAHLAEFRRDLDPVTSAILEAEIALAQDDLITAITRAGAAAAASPQSAAAHYVLGVAKFRAGDMATARVEWLTATEKDSSFFPARLALACQAISTGNAKAAEEQVVPVVREEPANLRALVLYARALLLEKRFEAATTIAKRALALTEANPEPHIALGEIALERGNAAAALAEYERAVIVAPQSQEAIDGLTRVYRRGHVTRDMLFYMESIAQQPPRSATIMEIVGRLYADHGWYEDAVRALNSSLAIEPQRSSAALALAQAYAQQGKIAAAEDSALRAGDKHSILLTALREQQKNDLEAAIRDYETVVREGDRSGLAANNLAWIYAQRGERLARALALAEAAHDKSPRNPAFLDTLGFVHLQRREYSKAVTALKQAVEAASLNGRAQESALPEIRRHLVQAYRLAGEPEEAQAVARRE